MNRKEEIMKSLFFSLVCILLVSLYIGCNNKKTEFSESDDDYTISSTYENANNYLSEIQSLRMKIKRKEAQPLEMIKLCERLLKTEDVLRDTELLVSVYITYSLYVEYENNYGMAEQMLLKAKDIAFRWNDKHWRKIQAGICGSLSDVYKKQKKIKESIEMAKIVIEKYSDIETIANGRVIKEAHSSVLAMALGRTYEQEGLFDEGIAYFTEVVAKYPNTITSHAAKTQLYNLQMSKGDESGASKTLEQLKYESQNDPTLKRLSDGIIVKWEAYKNGAHPGSVHKDHKMN
jgi:tetratricopeptide (TPR) repeat protein